jgi:hypothetical protein
VFVWQSSDALEAIGRIWRIKTLLTYEDFGADIMV